MTTWCCTTSRCQTELLATFRGPSAGIAGLRARVGATGRALTCSALKPQGLAPDRLAQLAERFARGGVDYIKDDHGLADQDYSRFAERVPAIAAAVARAAERPGTPPAMSPACPAISSRCAGRSAAPATPVSIP